MDNKGQIVQILKRGDNLKGVIYKDTNDWSFPYYGEIYRGDTVYTSVRYTDEDYVEQWIDQKFNNLIGRK